MKMLRAMVNRVTRRPPDFIIGGADRPYLLRWFAIPRNRFFNIYVHEFQRSDDDRALHDHPWFNLSILIEGEYDEHTIRPGGINVRTRRKAGAWKFRAPWSAHRIEIIDGKPCRTIFITGPRLRAWGFHCPARWVHWRDFTSGERGETVGKGCDQ